MAEFQQRDNSGSLFKNDKGGNESRPDYRGSAMVDGVEYWVSAWIKDGKSGKFMSLSYQVKEEQEKPKGKSKQAAQDDFDDSSDIPF